MQACFGGLAGRPDVQLAESGRLAIAIDWVGPNGLLSDTSASSGLAAAKLAVSIAQGEAG